MSRKVPKDASWCSYCITKDTCTFHGPDKKPYEGEDAYEPSEWVLEVVGQEYTAWSFERDVLATYLCFGYDPRHGFWMRDVDDPKDQRNISERAIGATFHFKRRGAQAGHEAQTVGSR